MPVSRVLVSRAAVRGLRASGPPAGGGSAGLFRWGLGLAMAVVLPGTACDGCGDPEPSGAAEAQPQQQATASASGLSYFHFEVGGAEEGESLPLLVALHGMGSRPETFGMLYAGLEEPARVVLARAPREHGDGFSWFLFRRNDPDLEAFARRLAQAEEGVAALLAELPQVFATEGRPVVTGFSQGGMLSYAVAVRHPERIRAAVPVAGAVPRPLLEEKGDPSEELPVVRAFHGDSDQMVGVSGARDTVRILAERGHDARLYLYRNVGHELVEAMVDRYHRVLCHLLGGEDLSLEAPSLEAPSLEDPSLEDPGLETVFTREGEPEQDRPPEEAPSPVVPTPTAGPEPATP